MRHEALHFWSQPSDCNADRRFARWSVLSPNRARPAPLARAQTLLRALVFSVLEPNSLAGTRFSGRLYCTPKALWKLNWFLRDFGYDTELLGRDEIDDKNLVGLSGVVKISHSVVNGTSLLNLDGFAPCSQWQELSSGMEDQLRPTKAAS